MHVYIAGGYQWQPAGSSERGQLHQALRIIRPAMQFHRNPAAAIEGGGDPLCVIGIGDGGRQPQRDAVTEVSTVGACQLVFTLGCAPTRQRDQLTQVAVTIEVLCQQYQPQAVVESELAADDELESHLFRRHMRSHHAGD